MVLGNRATVWRTAREALHLIVLQVLLLVGLSSVLWAAPLPPGAPVIGIASAENAEAVVIFAPPTSNGGSAITGYTVTSIPAGGIDLQAGTTATLGGPALAHRVSRLSNGTSYSFTVTATSAAGTGSASAQSNSITPSGTPLGPINFTPVSALVSVPVTVTVMAVINDPTVLSTSVNLLSLNASGAPTGVLGSLNDAGTGCDGAAGDHLYTGCISITPTAPGSFGMTVSAALNGSALRVYSAPFSITVAPSISVPNLVGLTQSAATSALTAAGLSAGTLTTAASATVPSGAVISQTPAAGSLVAGASNVALVISSGSGAPGAPTIGKATAGNAQATVSFSAPSPLCQTDLQHLPLKV